jgi:hypothetical protein
MAFLFSNVGREEGSAGRFLSYFKLKSWADLERPIIITEPAHDVFPQQHWFTQHGRRLRKPGPNSKHPDAIYCSHTVLGFQDLHWFFKIYYGYEHDSGWTIVFRQKSTWKLERVCHEVNNFINTTFEPESETAGDARRWRLRRENKAFEAAKDLFRRADDLCPVSSGTDLDDMERHLGRLFSRIRGGSMYEGRLSLDTEKFNTLSTWLIEAAAASTKPVPEEPVE